MLQICILCIKSIHTTTQALGTRFPIQHLSTKSLMVNRITSRCRTVLHDYNMSCDEVCLLQLTKWIEMWIRYFFPPPQQGKLILKRKPMPDMWKPGWKWCYCYLCVCYPIYTILCSFNKTIGITQEEPSVPSLWDASFKIILRRLEGIKTCLHKRVLFKRLNRLLVHHKKKRQSYYMAK